MMAQTAQRYTQVPFDSRFFTTFQDGKLFILTNFSWNRSNICDLYSVSPQITRLHSS